MKMSENALKESEKKREYRNKLKEIRRCQPDVDTENVCSLKDVFSSRMKKRRAILKMKKTLPVTPIKRVAIISSYLKHLSHQAAFPLRCHGDV